VYALLVRVALLMQSRLDWAMYVWYVLFCAKLDIFSLVLYYCFNGLGIVGYVTVHRYNYCIVLRLWCQIRI
jgi:hypothetical protein